MWLPTRKGSPFRRIKDYERLRRQDLVSKHERVLFLDLDNTLVSVTRKKPSKGKFTKIKVKAAGEGTFEKFYIVKRPHLDEFLVG